MKKKIFSVLLILMLMASFGLAVPVSAATLEVPSGPYPTIQSAINAASPGDTINVAAGTYTEDLVIPDTKTGLTLVGAEGAIIEGVVNAYKTSWPEAFPNIDIRASGVSISGFTIESPDWEADYYTSGMLIGATDVEIFENDFIVSTANNLDEVSQAIVTYGQLAIPSVDISGLSIHDNTFHGEGTVGYEGIYVNRDAGTSGISIADNVFTGNIIRGITTERSETTIDGNRLDATAGAAWTGVLIMDVGSSLAIANVDVTYNAIESFGNSVEIGDGGQEDTLTNISVSSNLLDGNVLVRASAEGVAINNNNILGSVENTDADTLDATSNWWGQSTGPSGSQVIENPGGIDTSSYLDKMLAGVPVTTEVLPNIIQISVDPHSMDFGQLRPGNSNSLDLTISNDGTIDVTVTASTNSSFYNEVLTIDGSTPEVLSSWSQSIAVEDSYVAGLTVDIPYGYPAGVYSGVLIFWAEATP